MLHAYTHPHLIGASLSEPHINGTAVREVYVCIYGTTVTRAPLHTFSTKAACNDFGCKVCVVKTTATFCSNIAHIVAIISSWFT